jgi:hypothetical protein
VPETRRARPSWTRESRPWCVAAGKRFGYLLKLRSVLAWKKALTSPLLGIWKQSRAPLYQSKLLITTTHVTRFHDSVRSTTAPRPHFFSIITIDTRLLGKVTPRGPFLTDVTGKPKWPTSSKMDAPCYACGPPQTQLDRAFCEAQTR